MRRYGGLSDLRRGTLRSPYPRERPLDEVWAEALPTPAERSLAAALGIGTRVGGAWACGSRLGASCAADAADIRAGASVERQALLQVAWWIKVLRDDPVTLLHVRDMSMTCPRHVLRCSATTR